MSLPCKSIEATVSYYSEQLGIAIGRRSDNWVDLNLFGHQLTFVESNDFEFQFPFYSLDEEDLPSFHFGVVLTNDAWEKIYDQINRQWSNDTILKRTFFKDKDGEQNTFIVKDPNGYYLEFKTFKSPSHIFL